MGFALAPMALAPISEIWGRFPVFIIAGVVFVVFQAVCSVMPHIAGLLVARFFVGAGASVFSSVVGGVIADIWDKSERNTPMALFSGSVLAGTGAGPLVGTAFVKRFGQTPTAWKWTFWHQVILDGVLLIFLIFWFKESRASVLLTRKAKKLNDWYEKLESRGIYGMCMPRGTSPRLVNSASSSDTILSMEGEVPTQAAACQSRHLRIRWIVKEDEHRPPVLQLMATSVKRPFQMLFTEPVVFCFSLWAAFSWAVLYLSFSIVPFLYQNNYNLSSRVYGAIIAAAVVATVMSLLQQHLLRHPQWRSYDDHFEYSDSRFWAFMRSRFPTDSPEARLYFSCITALFLPAGLFGAFLCPEYMSGYAEAIGLGFAIWGIYSIYLATFNYLADSYHVYASSALAAQNFCRNVLAGIFPLIVNAMFTNLGLKGAGGVLGGIAMLLSVIPWVLLFFGERIRSRSKLAIVSTG
jgi:MFS family permease